MDRRGAVIVWTLMGVFAVPALLLTLVRWAAFDASWAVQLTSFAPGAVAPYTLALLILGIGLLRGLPLLAGTSVAVVLVLGLVIHVCWILPLFVGDRPRPAEGAEEIVVMASNVYRGEADASVVADEIRVAGVDVLVLSEMGAGFEERLRATGVLEELPYSAGTAEEPERITKVFSTTPVEVLQVQDPGQDAVVVDTAGMTIVAAHAAPPTGGRIEEWHADHRWILDAAREHHADLIVGDLNATLDHEPVRRLVGDGWRDAEELVNGGFAPTWPAHGEYWPLVRPVAQIDHVLAADTAAVLRVDVVDIRGTDHFAVVATVAAAR